VIFRRTLKLVVIALLILAGGSVLAMTLRVPSHDRDWKTEHARLPNATLDGDMVTIEGLRDFSYGLDGTPSELRYRDATYRFSEIESLWYGISHFGPLGLAHTFVSFGFTDGRYLAISIEARQTVEQNYNPLLGLFGAYELIMVAGSERDIIGLRSHLRQERVYLYRIDVPKASMERVLRELLGRMAEIYAAPEFYHTVTDNCAMAIWRYSERLSVFQRYTNPKLLLPGYSDEVALGLGLIPGEGPLESLRRAARVDPGEAELDDPDFSAKIRQP
jgi:hypothetical protein